MNVTLSAIIGNLLDATPVLFQAGEAFHCNLTLPDSAAGTVSLRFWRRGQAEAVHSVDVDGTSEGVYDLEVPEEVSRYLDGSYYWSLWWLPDVGDDRCLMPASSMLVRMAGGVSPVSVDGFVTHDELTSTLADYPTEGELATALEPYVTSTGLTSTLADYPTEGELATVLSGYLKRNGGPTSNRPASPDLWEPYFDTTINCLVVWNGSAWQLTTRAGYADLIGDVNHAAAVAGLTNEVHRDTQFPEYYFRHDQDDTLYLKWQMQHDWDLGGVEPHIHVIGCASVTGNVRLTGRYCWSSIGGNLAVPVWSGWTTFAVTQEILGTDQWIPRAISLGTFTPPAEAKYPSAFLRVQLIRPGSSDALDTYQGSKPDHTAAANLMLEGVDCHIRQTGLGTAGLYS